MMSNLLITGFPPALIMIIGGFIMPFAGKWGRAALSLILPVVTLFAVWNIPVGVQIANTSIAGFNLIPVFASSYTHIFATIFSIAAFGGALFALFRAGRGEISSAFIYAGSAIGITFSGDLLTLFFFWEVMAIASTLIIFASDHVSAKKAGIRYAMLHFLGGVLLMCGIILHYILVGDTVITHLEADMPILFPDYALDMNALSIWLIMGGVLVNAAVPPLSVWLIDSYPKSSVWGGVFLSAFTTKAAVFVLITMFAGTEFLIYVGLVMIFYGIIYAILENNIRRILSYSIITQLGFMLAGVGIGTPLALNGVAAYAFAHISYKALLFMTAGSVIYSTGKNRISDLGGLSNSMKFTAICSLIGVLAMAAIPLTTSFATKHMIFEAAAKEEMLPVWLLFNIATAGVVITACIIKFPWFSFFQSDTGQRVSEVPFNMKLAMAVMALICVLPAMPVIMEETIFKMLPSTDEVFKPYSAWHILTHMQLVVAAVIAVFVLLPLLKRSETVTLDFDWIYRSPGRYIVIVIHMISRLPLRVASILVKKSTKRVVSLVRYIHHPEGILARNRSIGDNVTWMIALLGVYLVIYYF